MYGYGMFQAAATATDSLILLFAAVVLGGTPQDVGLVDAIGNIGTIGGAFALVLWSTRMKKPNGLFNLSILVTGLALVVFSTLNNLALALLLTLAIGLLMAPSLALAPLVASSSAPRPLWSIAFSQLSKVSSLGGVVGIALSAICLTIGEMMFPKEVVTRLLFVLLGALAVLGAAWNHWHLDAQGSVARQSSDASAPKKAALRVTARVTRRGPALLLSDQMKSYLVASFMVFAGMGMSYSGVHTYMASHINAPLGVMMAAFMGFRLLSYLVSGPSGEGHAKHFHIQVQSLAAAARGALALLLAVMGLLAPAHVALPFALLVVTLRGASAGILTVAGNQSVAELRVPGYYRQSQVIYTAVANAGGILGVYFGGMLSAHLGFGAMFLVAALLTALSALLLLRR
jgi:MFS family permease